MTRESLLTTAGIVLAAIGSGVGAVGVVLQMNGYYGFSGSEFLIHLMRMLKTLCLRGPCAARARMDATVRIGAVKGENRVSTMLGLYCVLAGFLLQTIGSALMIWALF